MEIDVDFFDVEPLVFNVLASGKGAGFVCIHEWARRLKLFHLTKRHIKLSLAFSVFGEYLLFEVFIRPTIFDTVECNQNRTFSSTLHGHTRIQLDRVHLEPRVSRHIDFRSHRNLLKLFLYDILFDFSWHFGL